MSPIDADKLNLSFTSPIAGPSLKVTGKAAKRPSEDWKEIVAEVTQVSHVAYSRGICHLYVDSSRALNEKT